MWKDELRRTAQRQHGVVSSRDLDRTGASRASVDHEMRAGRWRSHGRYVWALAGSPNTTDQRIMIGLLAAGPGSAISHHSAAALWGMPGFEVEPLHLTRMRGSNSTTPVGTIVHRVRQLPGGHIANLGPFAVVRLEVMLIQLAAVLPPNRTEVLLDRVWNKRLMTGSSLGRALRELTARGRRGIPLLRELLEDRGPDWVPSASGLEGRVRHVLEREGLHGFRLQVNLGDELWIGRVDFAHSALRVVLEVQSDRFHTALTDRRRDQVRHARLQAAGFQVVEIWEEDVWYRPERWLSRVREAMRPLAA